MSQDKLDFNGNKVYLGKRYVGKIMKVPGGFRYVPRNQPVHKGGTVFDTIEQVKRSLEMD